MKTKHAQQLKLAALTAALAAFAPAAVAQLTIPYADGSDGALNISNDTVIDLSQAVTGVWTNTSASPGNGIYDPTQWAVVFKYSSVNIAPGATVTFNNHPTHAPVVWLVSGNVTLSGTLSLNGQNAQGSGGEVNPAEPGPGGFRGGAYSATFGGPGPGFGPGGGQPSTYGTGGLYADFPYGTTNLIPLVGGSGGSASYDYGTGGAGGGAILVAAGGVLTINGSCQANGGSGYGVGSGGALRLAASQVLGNGQISAVGGNGGPKGRIRIEANTVANTLLINPPVIGVTPANPPLIFPPAGTPTASVMSVGGVAAPADPKAAMSPNPGADDITIATISSSVPILVQTQNFPTNGTVNVYIKPRIGAQSILSAAYVSGDINQAVWQVSASLPYPPSNQGHTVIQARAVLP